ncbi:hypothetical protein HID58_043994 [Brassica napus]|uniref:BnaC01g35610D protein n=3 Tax=Brassica TaxID=3705 RepID=A0A078GA41_BRANA|nr:hypothetical protein HID58_043994 [Brassica napus]CAF2078544.1 unnamed protein product [Brassica napus]CDY21887.1 BnaC01g35610D [Brassica napus]
MELMKKLFICGGELWTLDENGGPQGGYKWARIVIFWDIENCKVPSDCKAAQVREKILRSLWDLGSRGPVEIIAVAANESRVPSFVSSKLKLSGIRFDTLNTTVKQASDESIKRRIGRWMEVTPAHATLLLITRDKDFVLTLWKVERAGYNTILASDHGNKSQLLEYAEHYQFTWRRLLQHTFPFLLNGLKDDEALACGKKLHCHVLKFGLGCNIYVQNGLAQMYSLCGLMDMARGVFDRGRKEDVFSWNLMISGDKDLCKRVHGYVVGDVFVKEFMDMFPVKKLYCIFKLILTCTQTAFSSDLLQKPGTQSQTSPT